MRLRLITKSGIVVVEFESLVTTYVPVGVELYVESVEHCLDQTSIEWA
jgi:hypothetical protein